jgi:L-ascorbate metabolism protein UlaG (beta-lactamase superfamily)
MRAPSGNPADRRGASVTWLGHATTLVEIDGVRVLTDPAVTASLGHLRRRRPAPDAGRVDAVLISHLHMDHLHRPSLRRTVRGAVVVVPRGAGRLVRGIGASEVIELDHGASWTPDGRVAITMVPAMHSDRRGPHSRVRAAAAGYLVRGAQASVYFAGDTDLFEGMHGIGPVDAALVPIWGWGRSLGCHHLTPATAAEAVARVGARLAVPVHWGTYSPLRIGGGAPRWLDRPLGEFAAALDARDMGDRLHALWPGERVELARQAAIS